MFAIWMISPLLEVQLKSYHRPYECRQGWSTLLERFAKETDIQLFNQDEPILMLRRNASLTCDKEFEVSFVIIFLCSLYLLSVVISQNN